MQAHLFSAPGEPFPLFILEAARPLLEGQSAPLVAYLPTANIYRRFIRETKATFRDLARVTALNVESERRAEIEAILERATLLYIPGGNTYLLAQRLHRSGFFELVRERLLAGLPLVTFSAGTVICGQDILTTNDINPCGCVDFSGFGLAPFNFNVHYPAQAGVEREERDARIAEYQHFQRRTVLALEDDGYLRSRGDRLELARGNVWKFEPRKPKVKLSPGPVDS